MADAAPPSSLPAAPTTPAPQGHRGLARFSVATVLFNLAVILWGAFVRATGSGAGCGDHWPTCNGEVVPLAPSVETMIEFTHRATSGIALILVVVMFVWSLRGFGRGAAVRRAAGATMVFMIGEALVGAAIVLLQMVGDNDSMSRAAVMGVHLVNTFLLMGAMSLTAWLAAGRPVPRPSTDRVFAAVGLVALVAMLVLGASGGITALGDTLFPVDSLREGIAQDFSPTAHLLIRLRVLHPLIAFATGIAVLATAVLGGLNATTPTTRRLAAATGGLFLGQLAVGGLNLALLAPVWLQLTHLLVADLVWIALVLLVSARLGEPPAPGS